MRVCIVGYGRMGREIEAVCSARGHEVSARIDPFTQEADAKELSQDLANEADVAIEFSLPGAVLGNAKIYASCNLPAVVGTTGWDEDRPAVEALFSGHGAYLWGSNFSIGAHVFFALAELGASLVSEIPEYDLLSYEIHHAEKKDSPSGTALSLAKRLIAANKHKNRIVTEKLDRAIEPDELHVASVRGGSIPGIHTVMLDSLADTIEIRHSARSRGGFALGAVIAAEWVCSKTGFLEVDDFISALFS